MSVIEFKAGDLVVYPFHGVGRIMGVKHAEIAGSKSKFYDIRFTKDNMTLKIPVNRSEKAGLRAIGDEEMVERAMKTIKGRPKPGRGMWSRRAQEYQTKINSGDLVMAAQVVRDLHKNVDDPDRSYSERVIYESALERIACEFAAVQNIEMDVATKQIEAILKTKRALAANVSGDECDLDKPVAANDDEDLDDAIDVIFKRNNA
ncbi:MAG: CarD family transcriptional regulator [Rickettsiales bacterium]